MSATKDAFDLGEAARDFSSIVHQLQQGERFHRNHELRERVLTSEIHEKHWRELADRYSGLHDLIEKQKHPFQKWLSESPNYIEARRRFESKLIALPVYCPGQLPEKLVSIDTELEQLIADAIIFYMDLSSEGVQSLFGLPEADRDQIVRKASELLNLLDRHSLQIKWSRPAYSSLEKLAQGMAGYKMPLGETRFYRKTKRYRPEKRHAMADRESVIRYFVDKYMTRFGRNAGKKAVGKEIDFTSWNKCETAPFF